MDARFALIVASLEPSLRRLVELRPRKIRDIPFKPKVAGIYLLSEDDQNLYVGRSNNVRARLGRHSRPSASHRMAAFAFRLAREATGQLEPTYKKEGSRTDLMGDDEFRREFDLAKARIREMDVRLVEEPDPIRQAILEIYVATALATPYNSFDTH